MYQWLVYLYVLSIICFCSVKYQLKQEIIAFTKEECWTPCISVSGPAFLRILCSCFKNHAVGVSLFSIAPSAVLFFYTLVGIEMGDATLANPLTKATVGI